MDYYEILEVSKTATEKEIKQSYKKLVKRYHPDVFEGDKSTANQKIQELNEAYETLSNPDLRKAYDETLSSIKETDFDFSSIVNTTSDMKAEQSPKQKYEDLYRYDYYRKYTTNYYGVSRDDLKSAREKDYASKLKDSENQISSSSRFKWICVVGISSIFFLLVLMFLLSYLKSALDDVPSTTIQTLTPSLPSINFGMSFSEVEELLGAPDFVDEKSDKTYIYWGTSYIIFNNNEKVIGWHNNGDLFYTETVDGEDFTELQEFYNAIEQQLYEF